MDPLAKKIGDKAAQAVRQQVKDISEEVKEIPKSGKSQITGKDEQSGEQIPDDKKDNTQSARQQLLTLLRGSKKQTSKQTQQQSTQQQAQAGDDNASQKPRQEYLEREIEKARREREEKEKQRESTFEQQEHVQESQDKQPFVAPKGRKPRGMQNPMARKGEKKNELGRTAKG